ncbi:conserved hypothetical protein [Talaromyces stipitatus ATCC 10500]|uniref:N-acetyltransferase domain-containing protein n=1 Tax=Talaromyces stipitatus (strain ATCC 10500 / CBS 375.48 / QM 6759 / NRRL 1006) TaxID=441959 RepID=B8M7U4_TALSN|nr:uncharacterized protein TSTA_030860 [Talaromyces stipitatus ATCC 10500]EED19823.1 conserved hypothetical protein [Talaromyces stipitatus ATCC 10500]
MKVSADISALLTTDNDPVQHAEFKRQREICGWDYLDEDLQAFKEKQKKKLKSLFWIMIQLKAQAIGKKENSDSLPESNTLIQDATRGDTAGSSPSAGLFTVRAGHISLDSYADPPDPELALEDRSILTVQTFFILPEYRTGGVGRAAMDLVEVLATKEPYGGPRCHTLTLTTASKKYLEIDEPEWKGIWKKFGMDIPKFSAQIWYEKLGYVYWKEEPRYRSPTLDGSTLVVIASFMRKKLQ